MGSLDLATFITAMLSSGITVALINFFIKPLSDRVPLKEKKKFDETHEKPRLLAELKDINRHCKRNLAVLNAINIEQGKPSSIHFKKMKIYESSILFSNETYRAMPLTDLEKLYTLKTIIRNRNFEFDRVVDYLEKEPYDRDIISSYLLYVKNTMSYCSQNINESYFKTEQKSSVQPVEIVYHKETIIRSDDEQPIS